MIGYRVRLKSGKVETIPGSKFTINDFGLLSIYDGNNEVIAVYAPKGWEYIKVRT